MVARYSLKLRAERSEAKTKRRLLLFTIFLFGCSPASPSPTPAPVAEATLTPVPPATAAPTSIPDYATRIRNAQYQLGATDALRIVQLTDGKFEQGVFGGADFVSVHVTDFIAKGVFNGPGDNQYAVLVSENYGGSGTFVFLAVYADVNGTPKFLASTMVDDRPQLNALSIQDDEIYLDVVVHGSQDPMCCPALRTLRHYQFDRLGLLMMTDYTTFTPDGRPRTITIETPVSGTETYSSVQFRGSVAIAPFENNLAYRIYDIGGIELAAGSINVTATELGGPGTFSSVISLGNILSGSVVRVELQDISAADGSLFAMDSVELVVK